MNQSNVEVKMEAKILDNEATVPTKNDNGNK